MHLPVPPPPHSPDNTLTSRKFPPAPRKTLEEVAKESGKKGAEAKFLLKLKKLLTKVQERNRVLFLAMARKLAAARM